MIQTPSLRTVARCVQPTNVVSMLTGFDGLFKLLYTAKWSLDCGARLGLSVDKRLFE